MNNPKWITSVSLNSKTYSQLNLLVEHYGMITRSNVIRILIEEKFQELEQNPQNDDTSMRQLEVFDIIDG